MSVFHDLVKKNIVANREKHGPFKSAHEGYALIEEEFEELKREVFRRKRKNDPNRFLNELVQLAAYCEIFAEDMRGWNKHEATNRPAVSSPSNSA